MIHLVQLVVLCLHHIFSADTLNKNNIARDGYHISSLCLDDTDLQQLSTHLLKG